MHYQEQCVREIRQPNLAMNHNNMSQGLRILVQGEVHGLHGIHMALAAPRLAVVHFTPGVPDKVNS